ncbi:excinuclease ABC subunit UvrA [Streptomonospora sp. PA3]|uniref:ATP-binding cassette domain-containing protein n=1 Tax=Streptomonospora sp. PA3 TaxID=2607326 RepID=UPI0012DF908E|nr:excinuclease ABC subunit UvrA [Streptomonospora sp. PA3]MUL43868.1 excinuclease ABC subunit UvrA [Streptomonospora sp. PA3]
MAHDRIRIVGAREHNLKDIAVEIPKDRLTVVTGVSGSGKSSLVFDTIAAESQRQLNATFTAFARNRLPRYGRPDVDLIEHLAPAIVVDQRRLGGNARSTVGTITDIYALMRLLWSRAGRPHIGSSNRFSFNDPQGMCPRCSGLGSVRTVDVDELVDRRRSLNEGAIRFPTFHVGGWMWRTYADSGLFDTDKPLADYTAAEWEALLHGAVATVDLPSRGGPVPTKYEGLLPRFERIWLHKDPDSLKPKAREAFDRVVTEGICPDCCGTRLSKAARSSRIQGRTIAECAAMEAGALAQTVRGMCAGDAAPVAEALVEQLEHMVEIGLGYLTLDRPTSTLSGGESQRVKMVRHLGSSLTGMVYILDEPSVGLHPHDVGRLTRLLGRLRDKGNTVVVVEHDPDVIAVADHVVDMGPGAGAAGGRVVYQGDVAGLAAAETPTGRHLRHRPALNTAPRPPSGWIPIRGADRYNLRGVDVDVPTGVVTAVTGVAGSGKSTLIHGYLPRACPRATVIDQRGVHASRRSSVATYTGVLDPIRRLFARANGVSASLFSPNAEGACPACEGLGVVYTDLAFMDPLVSLCEDCGGSRFTREALRHRWDGRTIGEVLDLSVAAALEAFPQPAVRPVLARLADVGLGYLALGQTLDTLSGGERQRLKLADELGGEGGVYVFDEPTTGLHMSDVGGLVALFDRLVGQGAAVVVIEHDLDVVCRADWVVDLGPGPGRHGGAVVFAGPPAGLLDHPDSETGRHLRRALRAAQPA